MPSIKFETDTHFVRGDGNAQIRLRVQLFNKRFFINTGITSPPELFDGSGGDNGITWIRAGEGKTFKNTTLHDILHDAHDALMRMACDDTLRRLPTASLKGHFLHLIDRQPANSPKLIETLLAFAGTKSGRTQEMYLATVAKLRKYIDDDIPLDDVNKAWLDTFSAKELTYTSINSLSIHLRNIRAAFNFAIDNGRTTTYPFRRFKIKHETTAKRSLSIEQLVELFTIDCEPYQRIYRDMFMLSFFLIGINPVDLLNLPPDAVRHGRITYNRTKTKRLYNVKVEKEAAALISLHRGKGYLVEPLDTWRYKNWLHACDKGLGKIGGLRRVGRGGAKIHTPIEASLTMYWARHTWATLAAMLDVPDATISAALGHAHLNPTTAVYVNFDQRKVDAANRKVIDYVMAMIREKG